MNAKFGSNHTVVETFQCHFAALPFRRRSLLIMKQDVVNGLAQG